MRNVTHRKLCKGLIFHLTTKWYNHKPESVLENETDEILSDFEIQNEYPNHNERPDLVLINMKKKTTI